jgi:hypothetical protein
LSRAKTKRKQTPQKRGVTEDNKMQLALTNNKFSRTNQSQILVDLRRQHNRVYDAPMILSRMLSAAAAATTTTN